MRSDFRSLLAALLAGVVFFAVLPAHASSVQSVCSGSAAGQLSFPPFAADPPVSGGVALPRCISGPGAVSSSIASDGPPGYLPGFLYWEARSTMSVDPASGIKFSGYAQVNFNDVRTDLGIGSVAGATGTFLDVVTITAPHVLASGSGTLEIPLHITGSATTLGTVVGPGIPHTAELTYDFQSLGTVTFGHVADKIGLTTTGETITCGAAACGAAPVLFDQTVLVDLPFTFGEEFALKGVFGVDASFFLNAPSAAFLGGTSIADFAHTVTFGPARVLDANGDVVVGATIVSDIDYFAGTAAAVPEPHTFALLTAGLGFGLAVVRRRTRSRSR
jgi:hypothetical protein